VSKTVYSVDRAFTPDLPPRLTVWDSYLKLDDGALFAIREIAAEDRHSMVWSLVEDAYGNASFSPQEAKRLAKECLRLADKGDEVAFIWLKTVAAFAAAVGEQGKFLHAHAD